VVPNVTATVKYLAGICGLIAAVAIGAGMIILGVISPTLETAIREPFPSDWLSCLIVVFSCVSCLSGFTLIALSPYWLFILIYNRMISTGHSHTNIGLIFIVTILLLTISLFWRQSSPILIAIACGLHFLVGLGVHERHLRALAKRPMSAKYNPGRKS
jgi:hypothetical protein